MMLVALNEFKQKGLALLDQAEELVVLDQRSFEDAARLRNGIYAFVQQIRDQLDPVVKAAHEAHKTAIRQRDDFIKDYLLAAVVIAKKLAAFETTAQTRRAQEQAEAEAKAKAAVAAVRAANPDVTLVLVPQLPPLTPAPTAEGLGFRDQWTAEVTSLLDLARAVADGKITPDVLEPNLAVLNGLARSLKAELKIPGVAARHARIPVRR